jgi:myosin V
MHSFLL